MRRRGRVKKEKNGKSESDSLVVTKRGGVKNGDRRREGDEEEDMGKRGRSGKGEDR